MVGEHLLADLGRVGRRRCDGRVEGLHDGATEGLLLVGALHHEDVQVDTIVVGRLGKRGAPLAGTRLGRDLVETLLLGVVGLRERRVELVRAGGVVALELVVDLRRRVEVALEVVRAAQRGGAVHLVHLLHALGDVEVRGLIVELLVHELVAEHRGDVVMLGDLAVGQAHGLGRLGHVRTQVVPLRWNLVLTQVEPVGNLLVLLLVCVCHDRFLSFLRTLVHVPALLAVLTHLMVWEIKKAPGLPRAFKVCDEKREVR